MVVTDVEYMRIVNEVYDLSDYRTKKNVLFCNEAKKVENIEGIVNRLYGHIKHDVTGIDFRSVSKSKGVLSKIENYAELVDCINSVHDLIANYGESTEPIDVYSTALTNIENRERLFTKAFALNIEMPIMLYNITVTSVISAVSLLISSSIEYIKEGHESFKIAFDKTGYRKTKDHVLYEYLKQFNSVCAKGDIDRMINACIKNNLKTTNEAGQIVDYETMQPIDEGKFADFAKGITTGGIAAGAKKVANDVIGVAGGKEASTVVGKIIAGSKFGVKVAPVILKAVAAISATIFLLWLARKAVFYFFRACLSASDWFEAQATYLQINAENLKYRYDNKGDDHRKKVYQKQMKWVERFKKISNFLALKDSKAKKETEDNDKEESRRRTYDENDDYDGGLF